MDLGQVEVIKGVASALYGVSAVGGVVNLVSRRPSAETREVLINRTSHDGTDALLFLAEPLDGRWGYTFVGGAHWQDRSDLDDDGWTDLPMYRRFVARPRVFWETGAGASVLLATGVTTERRRGGTQPGGATPDGRAFAENDALTIIETDGRAFPIALVNAAGPTRTHGTEFLARYHAGELDVILSHMYLRSTEPAMGSRREVPLNPRHSAGLDVLWQAGPVRTGIRRGR